MMDWTIDVFLAILFRLLFVFLSFLYENFQLKLCDLNFFKEKVIVLKFLIIVGGEKLYLIFNGPNRFHKKHEGFVLESIKVY